MTNKIEEQAEIIRRLKEWCEDDARAVRLLAMGNVDVGGAIKLQQVAEDKFIQFIADRDAKQKEKWEKEAGWTAVEDAMPKEGDFVLARLVWDRSNKETYAVLQHKYLEDNAPWLYDGDELSFWVNVTHWKPFAHLSSKGEKE